MNHGAHRECTSGKGETEHVKVYSAGPTGEEVRRGSCEGGDDDADELLTPALKLADKRVVVKRPDFADFLQQKKPSFQLTMKKNRFDVYVN